ncbi:hypothetical protein MSAS_43700 [Mycobacterium saskatchewanense]|uniref:Probable cytochrome c oxidase subunit 3 n=1 Tax=Mycobacterium saskatchewanense TaxID=220927 RepID=A0AAJ3TWE6_9MYCO|nr:cytochrome c oxidase subunit 3 [Mycobacterium saskatchewanense]ORW73730.1 hypothetical protein AWC23_06525 [Mycobacterium saskatchewanense]BBX65196.1 hypothetical protein MSAS_43700 [Mycobacterium saskatchewanense]
MRKPLDYRPPWDGATMPDVAAKLPALPGDSGLWAFIAFDASLFALLFGQFSWDRLQHVAVFNAAQNQLIRQPAVLNTVVLVSGSLTMAFAVRCAHSRDRSGSQKWITATAALGLMFILIKVVEYLLESIGGHTLAGGGFFTYYYMLTGFHLTHVVAGVAALLVVAARQRRGRPPRRDGLLVESVAAYWHFVDLVWMFIFPLIYLAR